MRSERTAVVAQAVQVVELLPLRAEPLARVCEDGGRLGRWVHKQRVNQGDHRIVQGLVDARLSDALCTVKLRQISRGRQVLG